MACVTGMWLETNGLVTEAWLIGVMTLRRGLRAPSKAGLVVIRIESRVQFARFKRTHVFLCSFCIVRIDSARRIRYG